MSDSKVEKEFSNELGNKISITIESSEIKDDDNKYDGLTITMKGPDSTSENEITAMEAQMLFDSLSEFLSGACSEHDHEEGAGGLFEELLESASEALTGEGDAMVLTEVPLMADDKNEAASGTTQPTYIDESGKVFTPADIVNGYKPKGKYKGHSLSERVSSDSFGKS